MTFPIDVPDPDPHDLAAAEALYELMVDFGQWAAGLDIDPEARGNLNAAMRHLARVRAYLDGIRITNN